MVSITVKFLFAQFAFSSDCYGHAAAHDSCHLPGACDEMSMLQGVPAKRDVASVLVAEAAAEAKAKDLDPQAQSALVAAAIAEGTMVESKAEILHPSRSADPLLIRTLEFYKRSLEAAPHLTNGVAAYVITTMGDASAQVIQGGSKLFTEGFDVKRNVALALTASIYSGLVLTSWLLALNTAFPGFGLRLVMGKLAATQTFLQPFVYVPFFFIVHGMFCGQSSTEIRNKIRKEYFSLLFRLWALFMPTRFLMFLIIPVQYQVLWDNTVAFIWQFALSLMISKKGQDMPAQIGKKGGLPVILKKEELVFEAVKDKSDDVPLVSSDAGY